MKGVILAGGTGTRLFPLTNATNKHLLPVGKEPMIYNPIKQLLSAGISDILIITSKQHMGDVVRLLGSGKEFGCDFTFKVQEEAKGIAHALLLAEYFANRDRIVVILGDNITTHSIKPYVNNFKKQESGAKVLLRKVSDPERYGIAALDELKVIKIEEKPKEPKSNYAVIGIYMYDNKVFDIIKILKPSVRGEYEITSVNNEYIKNNELTYDVLKGEWTDAGTFESLQYANKIAFKYNNEIQENRR
ncbi:spore coat protein [Candidatus Atribacteria bacterium HGW-Atribacteria-1]|nr:MAG: spore coat protein [Candidatus Atribacteria bacterium HGW-Atribacteria-1]